METKTDNDFEIDNIKKQINILSGLLKNSPYKYYLPLRFNFDSLMNYFTYIIMRAIRRNDITEIARILNWDNYMESNFRKIIRETRIEILLNNIPDNFK